MRPAFISAYVLVERWISSAPGSLYSIKTMSFRMCVICGSDIPRNGLDIDKMIKFLENYLSIRQMTVTTPATSQRPDLNIVSRILNMPIIIPEEKLKKLKDYFSPNKRGYFQTRRLIEIQEHV